MKKQWILLKLVYVGYILGNTMPVESVALGANGKSEPLHFDSEMDALTFLDNEITASGRYVPFAIYIKS